MSSYFFGTQGQYLINAQLATPDDINTSNNSVQGVYTISPPRDGSLAGVDPESYTPNTGVQDVKIMVGNLGMTPIDSIEVTWTVNGISQPVFSATGLNLQSGESDYLPIGTYDFPKGVHEILVHLNVVGDTNMANNSYLSYAAVDTFWESFEGRTFLPENWSLNFAVRDGWAFGTPAHGNYYYSSMPDSNFFGVVSDTLFTPVLDISSGDSLKFLLETSAFLAANHKVIAKNEATGAIQVLQNLSVASGSWQSVGVDLTPAAGNTNRIGIVAWSHSPGHSKYDLITSTAKPRIFPNDLAVTETDIYFLAREGQIEEFGCRIQNQGSLAVNGGDYTLRLMQEPGIQLASVSGVNIAPWEEILMEVPHTFSAINTHRVYLEIAYPQDTHLTNNASRKTDVYVVPPPTILKSVGQPAYPTPAFPFNSNGSTNSLGEDDLTQTFYPKEDIAITGEIYGMIYTYDNLLETDIDKYIPLKIWIVQTDSQDLSNGWIPPGQLTLVYDDTMEILPGPNQEMYIPFDQPVTFSGLNNFVAQAYAYDPAWPPSILRFQASSTPQSGLVRTIGVFDYFALDPSSPPSGYFQLEDFVYTNFVINPISDSGQVSGVVYDTTGTPLSGAIVSASGINVSTITDANGQYSLPYLPYSTYSLTASQFGYFDSTEQLVLDSVSFGQDFYLRERSQLDLSVTIVGSNAPAVPLENVKVRLTGYSVDSTYTDSIGNALITPVFDGANYELDLSLYGYYDSTISVWVNNSQIDLDTMVLREEFISAFDVHVMEDGPQTQVFWKSPKKSQKVKLQNDLGQCSASYTNEPFENVWLGNVFPIDDTTTLTRVEIHTDVFDLATDVVRIDVFDRNEDLLVSSSPFLIYHDSTMVVDIPNIVVYDTIYAMLHWENNDSSTHALCLDFSDPAIQNTAVIRYPGQPTTLLSDFFGGNAPNMSFHLRVHSLDDDTPFTNEEQTTYNLYRGLAMDFPITTNWTKLNTAPLTAPSFTDATWTIDDSSTLYRYAVEAIYSEGNAMLTFSNVIDWENTVHIDEFSNVIDFIRIYPVPARHSFTCELEIKEAKHVSIALYDLHGKRLSVLFADKTKALTITEDVSSLAKGTYILTIHIENQIITRRLVVMR